MNTSNEKPGNQNNVIGVFPFKLNVSGKEKNTNRILADSNILLNNIHPEHLSSKTLDEPNQESSFIAIETTTTLPDSSKPTSSIPLTPINEDDDLQYITVYYKDDDEEEALTDIHRNLETIINKTNSELINILQSYGFKGDPHVFENPTSSFSPNEEEYRDNTIVNNQERVLHTPSHNSKENSDNMSRNKAQPNSSIKIQDKNNGESFNRLSRIEDIINSANANLLDKFKIFTYNKTENALEIYPYSNQNKNENEERKLDNVEAANKITVINRFVPTKYTTDHETKAESIEVSML